MIAALAVLDIGDDVAAVLQGMPHLLPFKKVGARPLRQYPREAQVFLELENVHALAGRQKAVVRCEVPHGSLQAFGHDDAQVLQKRLERHQAAVLAEELTGDSGLSADRLAEDRRFPDRRRRRQFPHGRNADGVRQRRRRIDFPHRLGGFLHGAGRWRGIEQFVGGPKTGSGLAARAHEPDDLGDAEDQKRRIDEYLADEFGGLER